jgi:hypothetical protein
VNRIDYSWIQESEIKLLRATRNKLPKPAAFELFQQKFAQLEADARRNPLVKPEDFERMDRIKEKLGVIERNQRLLAAEFDPIIAESNRPEMKKPGFPGLRPEKEKIWSVGRRAADEKAACFNCGEIGHITANCPKGVKDRSPFK